MKSIFELWQKKMHEAPRGGAGIEIRITFFHAFEHRKPLVEGLVLKFPVCAWPSTASRKPLVEGLVLKSTHTGRPDAALKPLVEGLVLKSRAFPRLPERGEAPRGGAGIEIGRIKPRFFDRRSPSWRGWY